MRWQYRPRTRLNRDADRAALAQAGFTPEQIGQMLPVSSEPDPEDEIPELLAENEAIWLLWCDLQTQWRVATAGATGLDYSVLPALWPLSGIRKKQRRHAFECLQAMERTALKLFRERHDRQERNTKP